MDEDRNQEPRERLRNILSSDENELSPQPESGAEPQVPEQPGSQSQISFRIANRL